MRLVELVEWIAAKAKNFKQFLEDIGKWLQEFFFGKESKFQGEAQADLMANWDSLLTVSGRGRRFDQRLTKRDIEVVEKVLTELGYELELFPEERTYPVEGYFGNDGRPLEFSEQACAMFAHTSQTGKLCIRKGATNYELFHEFMHSRHAKIMGIADYHKLGGYGGPILDVLKKEDFAFNKVSENSHYFTRGELTHAIEYINS